jgi:hypothetical protein
MTVPEKSDICYLEGDIYYLPSALRWRPSPFLADIHIYHFFSIRTSKGVMTTASHFWMSSRDKVSEYLSHQRRLHMAVLRSRDWWDGQAMGHRTTRLLSSAYFVIVNISQSTSLEMSERKIRGEDPILDSFNKRQKHHDDDRDAT